MSLLRDVRAEYAVTDNRRVTDRFTSIDDVCRGLAEAIIARCHRHHDLLADRLGKLYSSKARLVSARPSWPRRWLARRVSADPPSVMRVSTAPAPMSGTTPATAPDHRVEGSGDHGGEWDALRDNIFTEEFLLARPLLEAVRSPEPVVLLVDELDKADVEIEGLLLRSQRLPGDRAELGTTAATLPPVVRPPM
jgi:hypothetical protein